MSSSIIFLNFKTLLLVAHPPGSIIMMHCVLTPDRESLYDICFKLLIEQMVELALTEGRELKICHVLVKYEDFLREKNYEMHESCTT